MPIHLHPPNALELLCDAGAPDRLIHHATMVAEVALEIAGVLTSAGLLVDPSLVETGALVHDIGKTRHREELSGPGSAHEQAGMELLLEVGVPMGVARFCVSHADWSKAECVEERVVALADKLWKGRRWPDLEMALIDEVATATGGERWGVFVALDGAFEEIASRGHARLAETRRKTL